MARGDPYLPDPVEVSDGSDTTFDGSDSATDAAIVSSAGAKFDANVFLEAYDGSSWQEVTQLSDADGNDTIDADWHTQFNRVYVAVDERRIRIDNVDSASGWVSVEGDER